MVSVQQQALDCAIDDDEEGVEESLSKLMAWELEDFEEALVYLLSRVRDARKYR